MAARDFYPGTKRFEDPSTGILYAVTPTIREDNLRRGCGLEFDPPLQGNSEASNILRWAGAVLTHEKDSEGEETGRVKSIYFTPAYATVFVSPHAQGIGGENLLAGVRDRTGALIEGTAWEMTSPHRTDHQLQ